MNFIAPAEFYNPDSLPQLGQIINPADGSFFGQWSDLSGKRLLCIGFSEAEIDEHIAPYNPEAITMLTYWADHIDARVDKYQIIIGDITKRTEFADGEFDAVLTLSVLEHLGDLEAGMEEMRRVVRKGGEMLHMFGPAWTCAYGHHLYLDADDPNINFVKWQMPAHMHLLCDAPSIVRHFHDLGYSDAVAAAVIHDFYENAIINRRSYDDYVQIFAEFQIDRLELMYHILPDDHLERLRRNYPHIRDFSTYGGRYRIIL